MNFNINFNFKNMLIVSLILLTICISLGGVSASDANSDLSYIDGSATIGVANVDIGSNAVSSENFSNEIVGQNKTFDDIQKMVNNAKENDIIKLDGNYYGDGKFISINKPLTIDGNGAILDGKNISQFFYISGNNIVLKNINFINCPVSSIETFQGAIFWSGSKCLINNCTFTNIAISAIYGDMINGNISNCVFTNCLDSAISGEIINGKVSYCDFINCSSTFGGAGIYFTGSNGIIDHCSFKKCVVKNSDSSENTNGGAIYLAGNNCKISNSNFVDCSAKYGGAICVNYFGGNNCILENSEFSSCSGTIGGAINWNGENGAMKNCIFAVCSAKNASMVFWDGLNGDLVNNTFYMKSGDKYNSLIQGFTKTSLEDKSNKFIESSSVSMSIKQSGTYYGSKSITITLSKAIKDQEISLKFNKGDVVVVKTNSKGVATYNLPFAPGTYSVTATADSTYQYEFKKATLKSIKISKATATLTVSKLSTTYDSGKYFEIKVLANKKPVSGVKLSLKVYTGSKAKTVSVTTDSNGIAKYAASKLAVGTHKVVITCPSSNKNVTAKNKTSSIVISPKYKATITASKLSTYYGSGKYFEIKVVASKKPVANVTLKLKVYTGSKYKTVSVTTDDKGIAKYAASTLKLGTHKVIISSAESTNYLQASSKTSSIVISPKYKATITASKLSTTYNSGKYFQVKVVASKKPVANVTLKLKVYTGTKAKTVYITTDDKGIAKYAASKLSIGTHKVVVSSNESTNYLQASSKTSSIVIKKATTNVTAPKVTNNYKEDQYFTITIKNKGSGKFVAGLKLTLKVYTNKTVKSYTVTTDDYGVASFNTKDLSIGTHKVQITTTNSYYTVSKSGNLIVIKEVSN
ncbi:MAG: hypothetical protein Q4P14_03890 [Methanobacteriaceae archaeon]|nr:hypothetical protein [Methanobacteriaceae archaeon]